VPLRLTQRNGVYYIRGTVHGRRVYETTGARSKQEADAIRIKAEARLVAEHIHGAKVVVTFAEAAASYISAGGSRRYILERRADDTPVGLGIHLGARRLMDITADDLAEAGATLYPRASRETLIRQIYTPFIAVWRHAVARQWAEPRIWERPKRQKGTAVAIRPKRRGTHPVTYDKAARFVAAMHPAPAQAMTALFYTGMRPIELFALDFDEGDVNLDGRWIVVRHSKTGEPRGVPMHEFLAPLFAALAERGGRVFRTPKGEPYPVTDNLDGRGGSRMKTAIMGASKRSGILDVSAYTARHSCSTQLVLCGVHPHVKDQILGHAATTMSRRYTSVPQADMIEAINRLPVPDAWRAMPWWRAPLGCAMDFNSAAQRREVA
jgi:integrase/recombinase XerD